MRSWKWCLLVLAMVSSVDAGDRRSRRHASSSSCSSGQCSTGACVVDVSPSSGGVVDVSPSKTAVTSQGDDDALHEVNAERAKRGLRALLPDPLLNQAARACAKERARLLIHEHLPSDFSYLPAGGKASAAGCGALEDSWGWGACCTYDDYTYGGAAWVRGSDGLRYMHIFVR